MEPEKIINEYFEKHSEYVPVDFVIRGERKNKILEVFVDSEENLDLEKLSVISRNLNELIDKSELSGEFLRITVSSPGADKPFKYIWQMVKHIGRQIIFRYNDADITGKLTEVDKKNNTFLIIVKIDKKDAEVLYKLDEVTDIKIKLPF